MAYDPVKAHEYYEKYRKKGLKKGRKKGKKKTTTSKVKKQSLIGLSTSGLNDAGKMQWAMTKKDLQDQMNVELAKATTDEEKTKIKADYQNKALQILQKMKNDSSFAQAKKSTSKSGSGSKSSGANSSGGSSGGSSGNKSTEKAKAKAKTKKKQKLSFANYMATTTARGKTATATEQEIADIKKRQSDAKIAIEERDRIAAQEKEEIRSKIEAIKAQFDSMTSEEQDNVREKLSAKILELKQKLRGI